MSSATRAIQDLAYSGRSLNCTMAILLERFALTNPNPSKFKATAITDWNAEALCFASLSRKTVLADWRGGQLSTESIVLVYSDLEEPLAHFHAFGVTISTTGSGSRSSMTYKP